MKQRVYVDTEYCYPGMERGQPRPTEDDTRQIVQIAAIKVASDTGIEEAYLDQLVVPTYETQVPEFFTVLTGINQEMVDRDGIDFEAALERFWQFCGSAQVSTFDKDEEVFRQNCSYVDIPWPFSEEFIRVKPLLASWGVDGQRYSSGTLHTAAGIEMDGHVHNALHDVRSMAAAVAVFESAEK